LLGEHQKEHGQEGKDLHDAILLDPISPEGDFGDCALRKRGAAGVVRSPSLIGGKRFQPSGATAVIWTSNGHVGHLSQTLLD
jgi:hypothetical protein